MLEQLRYINHLGETLEFGKDGLFVKENDLHNFTWSVTSRNDRISGFKKGIVSKTVPFILKCNNEAEGVELRNRFFEVMEKDILALKYGMLCIGDYYMKCYVTESKKAEYLINKGYMKITTKVSTDLPYWIKESETIFGYGRGTIGTNLDYNRDFASDYTSNLLGKQLYNDSFIATNFRITIYGPCESPGITIDGHLYEVKVELESGEYLVIDSVNKTIALIQADGSERNCFNLRNKESYIFEKFPPGLLNVSTNSQFKFDIILLEERSEPKWI